MRQHIVLSCLWFAYNFQWGALLPIVLPAAFERLAGPAEKELLNGFASMFGAGVALVVTPIAGALSDRSASRLGRRRPYLLTGVLLNIAFLLLMAYTGGGSTPWPYLASLLGVQLGCNWWGGPYAGLIPDLVPANHRGRASGYMMVMTLLGSIAGAVTAAALLSRHLDPVIYASISAVMLLALAVTWAGIKESPGRQATASFSLKEFFVNPREHPDFYWVLFTRMLIMMGVYPLYTFFQYFLGDVVRVGNPAAYTAILLGVSTITAVPAGFLGGIAADRYGRRKIVYISGYLMTAAALGYVFIVYHPRWIAMIAISVIFAVANSVYSSVDWALAVDVLPHESDAAKDMGLWHTCMLVPQMISPGLTGILLTVMKRVSLESGYTVVFMLTALWFLLGTVLIGKVKRVT